MLDSTHNTAPFQTTGPSSFRPTVSSPISTPIQSHQDNKPNAFKSLSKMGLRMWLGLAMLVLLTVGGAAAAYLATTRQDLRQQAAPLYFGVGSDCTSFAKEGQSYCADTTLGSCRVCKDGKGALATDDACNNLPCGANIVVTQAANAKCSGNVPVGKAACADSEQVAGNCKKCEFDSKSGEGRYVDADPSECFKENLICGIQPTAAPTAKPTIKPTVGPTLKPSCNIIAGQEVCFGTSPVPTAVKPTLVPTKVVSATPQPTYPPNCLYIAGKEIYCTNFPGLGGPSASPRPTSVPTVAPTTGGICNSNVRCPNGLNCVSGKCVGTAVVTPRITSPINTIAPTKTIALAPTSSKCGSLDKCDFGKICVNNSCQWPSQVTAAPSPGQLCITIDGKRTCYGSSPAPTTQQAVSVTPKPTVTQAAQTQRCGVWGASIKNPFCPANTHCSDWWDGTCVSDATKGTSSVTPTKTSGVTVVPTAGGTCGPGRPCEDGLVCSNNKCVTATVTPQPTYPPNCLYVAGIKIYCTNFPGMGGPSVTPQPAAGVTVAPPGQLCITIDGKRTCYGSSPAPTTQQGASITPKPTVTQAAQTQRCGIFGSRITAPFCPANTHCSDLWDGTCVTDGTKGTNNPTPTKTSGATVVPTAGGICNSNIRCPEGLNCVGGKCAGVVSATVAPTAGGVCGPGRPCEDGLVCTNNKCVVPLVTPQPTYEPNCLYIAGRKIYCTNFPGMGGPSVTPRPSSAAAVSPTPGALCGPGRPCEDGLVCSNNKCVTATVTPQPTYPPNCLYVAGIKIYCTNFPGMGGPSVTPRPTLVAAAAPTPGGMCNSNIRCPEGLNCVGGKCAGAVAATVAPTAGGTCGPGRPCEGGLVCTNNKCVVPPVVTPSPKPAICGFGVGCPNGYSCSGLLGTCQLNPQTTVTNQQCNSITFLSSCDGDTAVICNKGKVETTKCLFGCEDPALATSNRAKCKPASVLPNGGAGAGTAKPSPTSSLIQIPLPTDIATFCFNKDDCAAGSDCISNHCQAPVAQSCNLLSGCPSGSSCSDIFGGTCKPEVTPTPVRPLPGLPKPTFAPECWFKVGDLCVVKEDPRGLLPNPTTVKDGSQGERDNLSPRPTTSITSGANPVAGSPIIEDPFKTDDPEGRCAIDTNAYCGKGGNAGKRYSCPRSGDWSFETCANDCVEDEWFFGFTDASCN